MKKKGAMVFVLCVAECGKGPNKLCYPTGLLCLEWISTHFVLPLRKDSSK